MMLDENIKYYNDDIRDLGVIALIAGSAILGMLIVRRIIKYRRKTDFCK